MTACEDELAICGIEGQIVHSNSFHDHRHPDLKVDFILANRSMSASQSSEETIRKNLIEAEPEHPRVGDPELPIAAVLGHPLLIHRSSRFAASAIAAVLFVMTAVTAAQASPNIETIMRKAPTSEHTSSDVLTWLLTFSEAVTDVDRTDFVVSGTTATLSLAPLALDEEGCSEQWEATLSGGDLAGLNGTVTLNPADFPHEDVKCTPGSDGPCIWGCLGNGESMTNPGPLGTNDNTFVVANTEPPLPPPPPSSPPPSPPSPPPSPGGGFGGGGAPRTFAPSEPLNLTAVGGDGRVVLTWEAPEDDGGAAISDYEYRNVGRDPWTSTGSTDTTHIVSGLVNGTTYVFEVRAVNRIGKSFASDRAEATPLAPEKITLNFPHFAHGGGVTSEVVLLNVGAAPVRPVLYFSDQQGEPIAAGSVVDVTDDLAVQEDGGLTVRTAMAPLGELTVATHGRGEQVSGSVQVVAEGPIGGVLRYRIPGVGAAGVGAGRPVGDALFPVRRKQGGIRTAAAMHNVGEEAIKVTCRLMSGGAALEEAMIPLEANGQTSWFIEEAFPMTDTTDFTGTVRCTPPPGGQYTGLAVEVDQANRIFTTLPVVPVDRTGGSDGQTVLDFPHFANGTWVTDLVFVNPSIEASGPPRSPFHPTILPSRPEIYFYDAAGALVPPASLVDLSDDLEVTEDGALTVRAAMEPLGVLTISTHGRGELLTGSVRVVSEGPIGGMLRYVHPSLGAAGMGAGPAVSDAMVPVRRIDGGVNTGVALHNRESSSSLLRCELMQAGVLLDTASIPLAANGQTSWTIDQAFPAADTSDFAGSLRCAATAGGSFSAVALETDAGKRIFTTLPVVPVEDRMAQK